MTDETYGDASTFKHPALQEFAERRDILHCVQEIKRFCEEHIEQGDIIDLDWVTVVQYLEKLEEKVR